MPLRPRCFIGIDPALESFCLSLFHGPNQDRPTTTFANDFDGFSTCQAWLSEHGALPERTVICVEATGVYAEALCYFLHEQGYRVSVESPHKVKRAFKTANKNDPTDARQIAEYAYRYEDELPLWEPKTAIIEQIRVLLTTRESLVRQLVTNRNLRQTLQHKVIQTPAAKLLLAETIAHLKAQIKALEEEIRRLIRQNPTLSELLTLLVSIPSVGLLLSAHLLVVTEGFRREVTARQLAAYLGICPYENTSGTSVKKPPKSRGYGPPILRKLVYLAAMNLKQHQTKYRTYYARKLAEGKSPRLVLNNLSNKLLRVICAVVRERQPYEKNYRSVSPQALQAA